MSQRSRKVAKARGRTVEQIDEVARGRVWSGEQAKARGLVDAFGGLEVAVADAAARAKLGKPGTWQTQYIEPTAKAQAPLRLLDTLLQQRGNVRVLPLAHCFCAVE